MISFHIEMRLIMPYITPARALCAVWRFDVNCAWVWRSTSQSVGPGVVPAPHFLLGEKTWSIGGCFCWQEKRMGELLKEYCSEERTAWLWRLWTNARAGGLRGSKGERKREDKDFSSYPRALKEGEFCISLCPEFQNWLLQEMLLLCWGLYQCHALPPLPLIMNGIRSSPNSNS